MATFRTCDDVVPEDCFSVPWYSWSYLGTSAAAMTTASPDERTFGEYVSSQRWTVEAAGRSVFVATVIDDWAEAGDPPFLEQVTRGCARLRDLAAKRQASARFVVPPDARSADKQLGRAFEKLQDTCKKAIRRARVAITSLRSLGVGEQWRRVAATALEELPRFAQTMLSFTHQAGIWRTKMTNIAKRTDAVLQPGFPGWLRSSTGEFLALKVVDPLQRDIRADVLILFQRVPTRACSSTMRALAVLSVACLVLLLSAWTSANPATVPRACSPTDKQTRAVLTTGSYSKGGPGYARFCGPGRAVVRIGERSFTIRGARCGKRGHQRWLYFGLLANGTSHQSDARGFSIVTEPGDRPRRARVIDSILQVTGVELVPVGTTIVARGLNSGTLALVVPGTGERVTGTWACA